MNYCLRNSDLNGRHLNGPIPLEQQSQMQQHDGPQDDDSTEPSTPEVLYAQIVPVPSPRSTGEDVHDNVTSPHSQIENGGVIYSELQNFAPR